ncbi:sulfatase-like hydrolase/transferase [Flammeovirga sp. MY04]|nr:sulfatase-like hydrolase/transferase [Flammeovirga sp. MY04]
MCNYLFACSSPKSKQTETKKKKPNIILLLADDMGYGEMGIYGQKVIKTPHLDQLAKKSMRFSNFYTGTSVCSPSRSSLMVGLHTGHTNIRGNSGQVGEKWDRVALKKSSETVAEMLKKGGYQTGFVGKWHLGLPEDESTWAYNRGFDFAMQEQWGISNKGEEFDERMHWINGRQDSSFYDYTKYSCLDEFRTDVGLNFLEETNKEEPFFLFMSYRTPHAHEFFVRENDLYKDNDWPEIEQTHAARITMFDQQVQRLLDKLEEMGELDNTFILFTSDNGPHNEQGHDKDFFNSSGDLKGYKRDLYEGGLRVPTFAYWKDHIEEGVITKQAATFYDVKATFAEVAGLPHPTKTDGISFLPTLVGEPQQQHDFFYWEIQEGPSPKGFKQAARKGHFKAVRIANSMHTELYDLSKDDKEEHDISKEFPELVSELNEVMRRESEKNPHWPYSGGIF